jgi:hypothetical protein
MVDGELVDGELVDGEGDGEVLATEVIEGAVTAEGYQQADPVLKVAFPHPNNGQHSAAPHREVCFYRFTINTLRRVTRMESMLLE